MIYLVKDHEKYEKIAGPNDEVISYHLNPCWSSRVAPRIGAKSHLELENTKSGPCLILGMGPSRHRLKEKLSIPVFGINRAVLDYRNVDYVCVHDYPALEDVAGVLSDKHTLVTPGQNTIKPVWNSVPKMPVVLVDYFHDPTRNKKRPLIWNLTTFAWTIHLALRMGFDPIYTLGIDLSEGGYKNRQFSDDDLKMQHRGVRRRTLSLFDAENKPTWYEKPVKIIDLSGGALPVEKGDFDKFLEKYIVV